jgi:hypothetical protein
MRLTFVFSLKLRCVFGLEVKIEPSLRGERECILRKFAFSDPHSTCFAVEVQLDLGWFVVGPSI